MNAFVQSLKRPQLSVVIAVTERHGDLVALHRRYRAVLERHAQRLQFIYVVDGVFPRALADLDRLARADPEIEVIGFSQRFGESTALTIGFDRARGDLVMTLPSYEQVEIEAIGRVLEAAENADLVVGRRHPRADAWINRLQAAAFHGLIAWLTGERFRDLGCSVRAIRRRVIDELRLYGDQHRFLPILVSRLGFRVVEVDVPQARADSGVRIYRVGTYARRLLDVLTVFFLVKFTRKPLRFFGLIGSLLLASGAAALAWIVIERLVFHVALAERPALLLTTMLIVLGVQVLGLGLIGELIIFTHARQLREYQIGRVIQAEVPPETPRPAPQGLERVGS